MDNVPSERGFWHLRAVIRASMVSELVALGWPGESDFAFFFVVKDLKTSFWTLSKPWGGFFLLIFFSGLFSLLCRI